MGKVTVRQYQFSNLFGEDPLKKYPFGKKKGLAFNSAEKSFRDLFINDYTKHMPIKDVLKNQSYGTRNLHEKAWVGKRSSFKRTQKITIKSPANIDYFKKFLHIPHDIKVYMEGTDNVLATEYFIAKQLEGYNFTTKSIIINTSNGHYTARLNIPAFNWTITEIPDKTLVPTPSFTLNQVLPLNHFKEIYRDHMDYIDKKIYPETVKAFRAKYRGDVSESTPLTKRDNSYDDLVYTGTDNNTLNYSNRSFRLITAYKYPNMPKSKLIKNRPQEETEEYKLVHVDFTLPENLFPSYALLHNMKNRNYVYFFECMDGNERLVFYKTLKEADRVVGVKEIQLSTPIPIKRYEGFTDKELKQRDRALVEGNYKNKKGRKSKKNKEKIQDLFSQVNDEGLIKYADVCQHIDLQWFFLKKIREDKYWQIYLYKLFRFFETIVTTGTSHTTAKTYIIDNPDIQTDGRGSFRIKLIKKEVTNGNPINKKCFISAEPRSNELYLYYNKFIGEKTAQGYTNYIQYALSLNVWYQVSNWYHNQIKPISNITNASNVGNREDSYTSSIGKVDVQLDYSNGVVTYIPSGFYYEPPTENWNNDGTIEDTHQFKHSGITVPKIKIGTSSESGNYHFEVTNENTTITQSNVSYPTSFRYDDSINEVPLGARTKPSRYNPSRRKWDSRLNYVPKSQQAVFVKEYIPIMPRKLWLSLPTKVRLAIYPSTIFISMRIEYEEKENSWFQNMLGFIVLIISVIIAYIFPVIAPAALKFGLSFFFSYQIAMLGNKWLSLIAVAISLYAAGTGALGGQSGGAIATTVNVLAVIGATIQAANLMTNIKYEKQLEKAKNQLEDTREELQEVQEQLAEELNKFVKLDRFNIDIDNQKHLDLCYYVASGEQVWDFMESGKYFEYDYTLQNNYDRFK